MKSFQTIKENDKTLVFKKNIAF